jgi:deoxycytidine triphosphate deaminase
MLGTSALRDAITAKLIAYEVMEGFEAVAGTPYIEGVHLDLRIGPHTWYLDVPLLETVDLATVTPRTLYRYHDWTQEGSIVFPPNVPVLAHSLEAVGSTVPWLTCDLDSRSTPGRFGLPMHMNAGHGEPLFTDFWVLEIVNMSPNTYTLPIGARVASLRFMRVEGEAIPYPQTGRYQTARRADWRPEMMLPRKGNW